MIYTVAVRALCDFAAKCGDLDLRFTPSPSAQDGIAGHAVVRSRRGPGYQAELSLDGEYRQLRVRGRADGYDPALNRIEEYKTYRGDLALMPDNHRQLHWAQAKMYGCMLCRRLALPHIHVALVYYDIGDQAETVISELCTADALERFFEQQCERFLAWAEQEMRHRAARDHALRALTFPHADFRAGQREMAQAVYKSASAGCCLMIQAPTGIGKTVGTLFPLLKAMPVKELDKIFYLAAKTSGRRLALDAVRLIQRSAPGLRLRVVELIARDKTCEHPDKSCHGASCPLAKGFYDRLPDAREAMLTADVFDKATTRELALAHQICPYYLSQEMVRWSDLAVGDYNYYFDVNAMLHAMATGNHWRISVLVDEAHNMIERARKMYSAELDQASFQSLRKDAPTELTGPLNRLNRVWNAAYKGQEASYRVYPAIPEAFVNALQQAIGAIAEYLAANSAVVHTALQRFYFDALLFSRIAEAFGDHSLFDITIGAGNGRTAKRRHARLCIRNLVPAPFLKPRFAASHSTSIFSATLSPQEFYNDMLGLPQDTPWIEVPSPFRAEQLSVRIVSHISTRYRDREDSLSPIVELMTRQFEARPGNYLAFLTHV